MKRKHGPKVRIHDPGFLGSVLISSETDEFTIQDLCEGVQDRAPRRLHGPCPDHHHDPKNIEP